jgi:hypothetical protein
VATDSRLSDTIELVTAHRTRGLAIVPRPVVGGSDVALERQTALGQEGGHPRRLDSEREALSHLRQRGEQPIRSDVPGGRVRMSRWT